MPFCLQKLINTLFDSDYPGVEPQKLAKSDYYVVSFYAYKHNKASI